MRVGITGHQRLDNADSTWPWVEQAIREELDSLPPPIVAVTSLAIGADQVMARLAQERGALVHAVLPFADIERTLPETDRLTYRRLAARALVEIMPVQNSGESPGGDEDAFLAAGKRVVDLSDVMIAVWDGLPARGRGGTADIVQYALATKVPVIHLNPITRQVSRS